MKIRRFQVIQGGKQSHAGSLSASIRLFRATSYGSLTKADTVYHGVKFNWYCLERVEPAAPYARVISDYERLDPQHREAMRREIDRYFTDQEAQELGSYLNERYGLQLAMEEVDLPLKKKGGFFEEGSSVVYDFLELCAKPDYPLTFKVWGYYALTRCLSASDLDNALLFIRKSLRLLGLKDTFNLRDLEAVAKTLHAKEGLIVKNQRETS